MKYLISFNFSEISHFAFVNQRVINYVLLGEQEAAIFKIRRSNPDKALQLFEDYKSRSSNKALDVAICNEGLQIYFNVWYISVAFL